MNTTTWTIKRVEAILNRAVRDEIYDSSSLDSTFDGELYYELEPEDRWTRTRYSWFDRGAYIASGYVATYANPEHDNYSRVTFTVMGEEIEFTGDEALRLIEAGKSGWYDDAMDRPRSRLRRPYRTPKPAPVATFAPDSTPTPAPTPEPAPLTDAQRARSPFAALSGIKFS